MNFLDIEVKINKPYPELVNIQEDANTVAILKNLANSRVGELGAILQYTYQSVIADKTYEQIAEIFEEIGVVEMMHLDMLMHAISLFGGVPKYDDSQGVFFNTVNMLYPLKLKEMLDLNIKGETLAIENYKMAIPRVQNQSLKMLFERIIEDEERHLSIFKKIRDNVQFMSI